MSLIGTAAQLLGAGAAASMGGILVTQHKLIGEVLDELCLRLYFWRPGKVSRRRYVGRHVRHSYSVPRGWNLQ